MRNTKKLKLAIRTAIVMVLGGFLCVAYAAGDGQKCQAKGTKTTGSCGNDCSGIIITASWYLDVHDLWLGECRPACTPPPGCVKNCG